MFAVADSIDKTAHLPPLGSVLCVRRYRQRLAFAVLTFLLPLQHQHLRSLPVPPGCGGSFSSCGTSTAGAGARNHEEKALGDASSQAGAHGSTESTRSRTSHREARHSTRCSKWRPSCLVTDHDGAVAQSESQQQQRQILREARKHPGDCSYTNAAEPTSSGACCSAVRDEGLFIDRVTRCKPCKHK